MCCVLFSVGAVVAVVCLKRWLQNVSAHVNKNLLLNVQSKKNPTCTEPRGVLCLSGSLWYGHPIPTLSNSPLGSKCRLLFALEPSA